MTKKTLMYLFHLSVFKFMCDLGVPNIGMSDSFGVTVS